MIVRSAVRVLLVDPDDRLLLLELVGGWWITVGGGLEGAETPAQAAVREVAEETGLALTDDQVGPAVWRVRRLFPWLGEDYDQSETFHLVRCPAFTPSLAGLEEHEVPQVLRWRWWTLDELSATTERVVPQGLAAMLPEVLAGPWQGAVVDLGTTTAG